MCSPVGEGLIQRRGVHQLAQCLVLGGALLVLLSQISCQGELAQEIEWTGLRQARRVYDGAPPIIPHAVGALGRRDCLNCHEQGLDLEEDGVASLTPHPQLVNCRQCHLEVNTEVSLPVNNLFEGYRNPRRGTRAHPLAPPTVPHPVTMRENCLTCHSGLGATPIRTSHPERVNCRQCHLTQLSQL